MFALAAMRAFFSRSMREMNRAQVASPVMLRVVRPMSNSLSTPAMIAMPSTGRPTCVRTIASMIMPAPGVPAVPMEARVAVTTIMAISPSVRFTP